MTGKVEEPELPYFVHTNHECAMHELEYVMYSSALQLISVVTASRVEVRTTEKPFYIRLHTLGSGIHSLVCWVFLCTMGLAQRGGGGRGWPIWWKTAFTTALAKNLT
jgi:hypothetical protein